MNLDLSSVLEFLLLYFIFCLVQYIVSLLGTVFDLAAAYLGCKLVDYQEKLDIESKKSESSSCIGFQIPIKSDEEEEDDE